MLNLLSNGTATDRRIKSQTEKHPPEVTVSKMYNECKSKASASSPVLRKTDPGITQLLQKHQIRIDFPCQTSSEFLKSTAAKRGREHCRRLANKRKPSDPCMRKEHLSPAAMAQNLCVQIRYEHTDVPHLELF